MERTFAAIADSVEMVRLSEVVVRRRAIASVVGQGDVDHTFFREVIRTSSVIALTVGVYVDAHDYRAPRLRRIVRRVRSRIMEAAHERTIARTRIRSCAVDASQKPDRPSPR